MQSKQSFSNPSLQAMDFEAEGIISNHSQKLNQISNDIKELEATLKKAAIPFEFVYILFTNKDPRYKIYCSDVPCVRQEIDIYHEHCLVWSQTKEGVRLRYNVKITRKEYDPGNEEPQYSTNWLESSIPLIEAKAITRLQIEKDLPFFYKNIIEKLEQNKKDSYCYFWSPFYVENSPEGVLPPSEDFDF